MRSNFSSDACETLGTKDSMQEGRVRVRERRFFPSAGNAALAAAPLRKAPSKGSERNQKWGLLAPANSAMGREALRRRLRRRRIL